MSVLSGYEYYIRHEASKKWLSVEDNGKISVSDTPKTAFKISLPNSGDKHPAIVTRKNINIQYGNTYVSNSNGAAVLNSNPDNFMVNIESQAPNVSVCFGKPVSVGSLSYSGTIGFISQDPWAFYPLEYYYCKQSDKGSSCELAKVDATKVYAVEKPFENSATDVSCSCKLTGTQTSVYSNKFCNRNCDQAIAFKCNNSDDCLESEFCYKPCKGAGFCMKRECKTNADCKNNDSGKICDKLDCKGKGPDCDEGTCTDFPRCTSDDECPFPKKCLDCSCVDCIKNSDCPPGKICNNGGCVSRLDPGSFSVTVYILMGITGLLFILMLIYVYVFAYRIKRFKQQMN